METARSLITGIGVSEGDILAYLEEHGSTTMRRLTRELDGASPMVMMAIGALVRGGLIRAIQHDLEIILEPLSGEVCDGKDDAEPAAVREQESAHEPYCGVFVEVCEVGREEEDE